MKEGFNFSFNNNGRVEHKPTETNKAAIATQKDTLEKEKKLTQDQQVVDLASKFVELDLKSYDLKQKLAEISKRMMDLSGKLENESGYSKELKLLEKGESEDHVQNDEEEYSRLEDEFMVTQLQLEDVNEARYDLRFKASEISPTAEDYFMQLVLSLEDQVIKDKANSN